MIIKLSPPPLTAAWLTGLSFAIIAILLYRIVAIFKIIARLHRNFRQPWLHYGIYLLMFFNIVTCLYEAYRPEEILWIINRRLRNKSMELGRIYFMITQFVKDYEKSLFKDDKEFYSQERYLKLERYWLRQLKVPVDIGFWTYYYQYQ